jgi:ABC-type branched-subunit amino acid transport system ATPase component
MLNCEQLRKSFGGVRALWDFSVRFPDQGIIAIIGPNGAGKTTLVNVISGLIRPDAGSCFLRAREITGYALDKIARLGIARSFQTLRLIRGLSVLDNALLARPGWRGESFAVALCRFGVGTEYQAHERKCLDLLQLVRLFDKRNNLAEALSYGEQKLLSIVCCLATDAQVLVLDEPVAGVHPEMAVRILDVLREIRQSGKLVIFIEHDIAAVRAVADMVVVMDHGEKIAEGTPEDVLSRPRIIEAYVG